jgi:hypothetical protein
MAENEQAQDEDLTRPAPRPRKPTGLTPMKAKPGKKQQGSGEMPN